MSTQTVSTSSEVIKLDDNVEDNNENGSVHNLSDMDSTEIHFDETLPPGVAPDGFVILDEDIGVSRIRICKDERPIFKIVFRDVSTFENYHEKIDRFLKELILPEYDKKNVKSSTRDLILEIFDTDNSCTHSSDDARSKEWLKEKQTNDSLFTVDTEPKTQDDLDIPMYRQKFSKPLQKPIDEISEAKDDCGPKRTCFNCLGNHSLRECKEPRNYKVISKNRKNHNAMRGSSNVRYHLDDNQKFGHFVPGRISSNLRRALGIKENELPRHIYRMRILGYPPGWLEEARLQHSGLALFNSDGCADNESDEDGEIVCPGDKDKYDIKKIIDFPGFNVVSPYGTQEECNQYWGSAVQEHYSKTAMLSFLSNKKVDEGYVRRKLPNPANSRVNTDVNPGEMDIDEVGETSVENVPVKDLFIPPLPKDNVADVPPPPPPPTSEMENSADRSSQDISVDVNGENAEASSRIGSPSLFDLECTKKQLLAELHESGSQPNQNSSKTDVENAEASESLVSDPNLSNATVIDSDSPKVEESNLNKIDVNNVTPKNSPKSQTVFGSGHKSIIAIHLGTPVLKSSSPYRKLPDSENFSKDICEVINFENLPDSTGKYDQMSELLQKVRSTISELHK